MTFTWDFNLKLTSNLSNLVNNTLLAFNIKFQHLAEVNKSYTKHFIDALNFSLKSFEAGYYFLIHAIIPDYYVNQGTKKITKLAECLKLNEIQTNLCNKINKDD